jgi:fatty acid desaturase
MKELVLFLRRLVMLFIAFIFGGIVGVGWLFGVSIILVLLGVYVWSFHRIDKLIKLEKDEEII